MKLPNSVKNLTSIIGASLAIISFLIIFFPAYNFICL
jgi:hypothetical protein